jgi:hypothetical protein
MVCGCFETGKLRVHTGTMCFFGALTTRSQQGNVALALWRGQLHELPIANDCCCDACKDGLKDLGEPSMIDSVRPT